MLVLSRSMRKQRNSAVSFFSSVAVLPSLPQRNLYSLENQVFIGWIIGTNFSWNNIFLSNNTTSKFQNLIITWKIFLIRHRNLISDMSSNIMYLWHFSLYADLLIKTEKCNKIMKHDFFLENDYIIKQDSKTIKMKKYKVLSLIIIFVIVL